MTTETLRDWYNRQTDDYKMDFMRMRNRDYPEYNYMGLTEFMENFEQIWREDKKKRATWPIKNL
jgi:hypothetical protein